MIIIIIIIIIIIGVGILNSDEAKEKRAFKQERQNASLNRWKEKKMHGQFLRDMPETVDKDKMWLAPLV